MRRVLMVLSLAMAMSGIGDLTAGQTGTSEPGIYLVVDGTPGLVPSTLIDKAAPSGMLSNAASLGFKGVDIKARIPGATSHTRMKTGPAEFIFRGDSFKPTEHALVRVESRDDRREFKTGKVGMLGRVKSALDKDAIVKTQASKTADGAWRVVPEKPLQSGEYAFVLLAVVPERVWSFGVD